MSRATNFEMSNLGVTKDAVSSQKGSSPNGNGSSSQTPAKTGHPLENSQQNVAANAGNEDGNEKREITEEECQGHLGFHWSDRKKWLILTVVFWVQISMNFNTSLYFNGIPGIMEEFGVAKHEAIYGAAIFLLFYAFGCELWAPWSEELGRWPVLQLSLFFVNVFQLPVALAPNFASVLVGRALGGLSSAGGSVTLAMVADLADTDQQQKPVAFICQASLLGSIIGPIVGGFLQQHFNWRWCIWVQLIFGLAVQLLHCVAVPETRPASLMNKVAQRRRKQNPDENIWGPDEVSPFRERLTFSEVTTTWLRPFKMFVTEPIVLVLSLLSGFGDSLAFVFIESFGLVYKQWGFGPIQVGLAFIPIGLGYLLSWAFLILAIHRNIREREAKPNDDRAQYESRLRFLLWTAPCLPIGLLGFALTNSGPPVHWIASMIFAGIFGIANYAIYATTIDYMICAYGPYSASATGGNGFARDFMAGVLCLVAHPFFTGVDADQGKSLKYACLILFGISFLLVAAVYVVYWKGPQLRQRSPFAQKLANERDEAGGSVPVVVKAPEEPQESVDASAPVRPVHRRTYSHDLRFFGETRVTPRATPRATPVVSRANSFSNANRNQAPV